MWQDYVLMVGNWVFLIALIPLLKQKSYEAMPPISTSLSTFITLVTIAICYGTLGLYTACFSCSLSSIAWGYLFYRRWRKINL